VAGVPGRGGYNRLSLEQHALRGTFRRDRHGPLTEAPRASAPVTPADRRRTLRGLSAPARLMAARLLVDFSGWDSASLETLRAYVQSCERLEQLQQATGDDSRPLHREIRCNLNLLRALNLERLR
jgi:hypothetical protein